MGRATNDSLPGGPSGPPGSVAALRAAVERDLDAVAAALGSDTGEVRTRYTIAIARGGGARWEFRIVGVLRTFLTHFLPTPHAHLGAGRAGQGPSGSGEAWRGGGGSGAGGGRARRKVGVLRGGAGEDGPTNGVLYGQGRRCLIPEGHKGRGFYVFVCTHDIGRY